MGCHAELPILCTEAPHNDPYTYIQTALNGRQAISCKLYFGHPVVINECVTETDAIGNLRDKHTTPIVLWMT